MNTILKRIRQRVSRNRFPETAGDLAESDLFTKWWYYSVELLPGYITKGQYPDEFPLLPRMLLRNCDLRGATCLDLGSMEGLIPVLMCRQGAKTVVATDAVDHCHDKMAALRHYYRAEFSFQKVGLMYDLTSKLRKANSASFDVINLSGLLYHVYSPLMVLAGVRPLLKRNGLIIVSTNVVVDESTAMHLNDGGRFQDETNTFWYLSIRALDYLLRYLRLAPIDCLYLPHRNIKSTVRYVSELQSGYCSIVCRAQDDVLSTKDDAWMRKSARVSWEYTGLTEWSFADRQKRTEIAYSGAVAKSLFRGDLNAIDLSRAVAVNVVARAEQASDAHVLKLSDIF
jgi:2-polyprenyl-3-methyl-5-hydroxy-6-metoxy-1,4-benzoquinol methylase